MPQGDQVSPRHQGRPPMTTHQYDPLIAERRQKVADILAELNAGARASAAQRLTELTQELPKVTLRDGPFQGLPPDPNAAWGPIPGTSHKAWAKPPEEQR